MMNWMISKTILLQLPRFGAVLVAHGVVRLTIIDSSGSIVTNCMAIKQAERNANQAFNDELFEYFSAKDDNAFW